MAIKKNTPAQEQRIERKFNTKGEAEVWAKKQKTFYKESGFSTRYDIKLVTYSNQWEVIMYIYLDNE